MVEECTDVLKHVNAALKPNKSLLVSVLDNHDPALVAQFVAECSSPQGKNKTLLFRIHHLCVNIKNVASQDSFVWGVVNPSDEKPEGPSKALSDEGSAMKTALQGVVAQASQNQVSELEEKLQSNDARIQALEREILDLTSSRKVMYDQLQKRKEAFELRIATSSNVRLER